MGKKVKASEVIVRRMTEKELRVARLEELRAEEAKRKRQEFVAARKQIEQHAKVVKEHFKSDTLSKSFLRRVRDAVCAMHGAGPRAQTRALAREQEVLRALHIKKNQTAFLKVLSATGSYARACQAV